MEHFIEPTKPRAGNGSGAWSLLVLAVVLTVAAASAGLLMASA